MSNISQEYLFEKTISEELKPIDIAGSPLLLLLRSNEKALISSVRGVGLLKLSAKTADGLVVCQSATLFDSKSRFWMTESEEISLNHVLSGGSLIYSLWCERHDKNDGSDISLVVSIKHLFNFERADYVADS